MGEKKPFDPDDFTFAPHDKALVIMEDKEMVFMAMPENIIQQFAVLELAKEMYPDEMQMVENTLETIDGLNG